ncbi:hypothetical protein BJI46_11860 [Acinetobacter qingfengensis]|uniref:Uncharacterized protein n=1 Tax=Acinetobacter qingfengensis TaxID=1262585 RepID=A0A1E7RCD3_9GAMM|nr:hypothetical protein BJI46_11860 [Acinetobacter qingfengensis]
MSVDLSAKQATSIDLFKFSFFAMHNFQLRWLIFAVCIFFKYRFQRIYVDLFQSKNLSTPMSVWCFYAVLKIFRIDHFCFELKKIGSVVKVLMRMKHAVTEPHLLA